MQKRLATRYRQGIKALVCSLIMLGAACCTGTRKQPGAVSSQVWHLNSLQSVGGVAPEVWGTPRVVDAGLGAKAIAFDGIQDGLLLPVNPVAGAEAFEIEVEFMPYAASPNQVEQRFLHIQEPENPDRRILIELRLNNRQQWYADFFMRSENASLTLIDSTKTHPVNEWATITLRYENGTLKGSVNGVEEVSGKIEYLPISPAASTSIGTRMDRRSWFKGAIKTVRIRTWDMKDL